MKSKIVFLSLLLLNCAVAEAEYSYSDGCKIRLRAGLHGVTIGGMSQDMDAPDYLNAASPFLVAAHEFIPSDKLEKINRYNGWYNDQVRGVYRVRCAAVTQIVEPAVFLGADYALEKCSEAAIQTEAAKSIKQAIPAEYHTFAAENGKFILAAAGARFIGTVAKGGSIPKNAKSFGKNAVLHLGSNGLEEYVINPWIDNRMGSEYSNTKECAKFAANGTAMLGLHVGLYFGLKMLGA